MIYALGLIFQWTLLYCVCRTDGQAKELSVCRKSICTVLRRHSNAKLVFIGDGADRAELEQAVHDEGVTSSVLMLGVREDINELYSMLDTFFMPSLYEGLPVWCVEASAAGLHLYTPLMCRENQKFLPGTGIFVDLTADYGTWSNALEEMYIRDRSTQNPELLALKGYSAKENAEALTQYYERLVIE